MSPIKTYETGIINWCEKTGIISIQGDLAIQEKLKEVLPPHIEEKSQNPSPKTSLSPSPSSEAPLLPPPPPKFFIVHGHDHVSLDYLELTLRRLELAPYILQNTSGNGLTIIEALEQEICAQNRSIKFGIVLLTPDDMGYAKTDGPQKARPRARENVIFEMGMLISALSRKNVAILMKEDVDLLSDIKGIRYIPFKNHVKETVPKLIDRLLDSGFDLDPKKMAKASN
ncbi:TIR domain-containing protein [Bartonella harrusi]|uniref:Nucleotide-binding protein n=1 Tax=Bartonella harrusi TaxID=2961895 RepID=A0ABY5ES51_9HYPH|nr:TIR domain-containing protein [Bartonella harrusi]UTO28234.1 nucleotide-binding protein [Bartonella harrusi]